ncbi:MAG: choice-of-anchor J domain-containing protein [Muribaculaceae bacterium]|nr:choice-of-anchor J domain-containing protein [Muribaculaceae bacterium]
MKSIKKYFLGLSALLGLAGLASSCQDDFDNIKAEAPVATLQANTTIAEVKALYWDDATNYATKIPVKDDGSHVIIKGRVISSDEASNVFKSLVIQDETAALAFSINSYNLYLKYRRGQEIVVDLTDMYIGKYNGLQQIGMSEWYAQGNAYEVTFMAPETFTRHAELNGWPEIEKIDTLVVNSFAELSTNPDGLQKMQSQLVRFNNVSFQNGGNDTFSTYHSSGVNQVVVDAQGATMNVRTSGYANFWNKRLPTGSGDIVGILSYYGTSGWQFILIDYEGCMNFGNPTLAAGTESNPYDIASVIAIEEAGTTASGWVKGFIAGAVAPDVETVSSASDIEWGAPTVLANTLVIAPDMDTRDISKCLVMALPAESPLREAANLRDNPDVLGKEIAVRGSFGKYMGTFGVLDNSGAVSEFKLEGFTPATGNAIPAGDGSLESPWNATQVLGGTATGTSTWVKGYIVGYIPDKTLSEAIFDAPATAMTNILVALKPDVKDYSQCVPVQLPVGSVRSELNLQDNPGLLGKAVSLKGSVEKYFGVMGLKSVSEYVLEGGSPVVPPTPGEALTSLNENFDASTSIPAGWTQVQVAGNKSWYVPTFNGNNYAAMTGYKGTAPFDQWLVSPGVDMAKVADKTLTFDTQVNGYGSTTSVFEVYVLNSPEAATATKTKLSPSIAKAPASGYSDWVASGALDLSAYSGVIYIGFRYYATADANFATWCVDNVKLNAGSEPVTPPTPPTPPVSGSDSSDFNTFNGGTLSSTYGSFTNSTGWSVVNAQILAGNTAGAEDSRTNFAMFGGPEVYAVCLNGRDGKQGILTSSVLAGGCKTLTFDFGHPYADTNYSLTVNIKQGDVVAFTQTLEGTSAKGEVRKAELAPAVSGDFVIEIVNNGPSKKADGNKDRVAIWNLTWTK